MPPCQGVPSAIPNYSASTTSGSSARSARSTTSGESQSDARSSPLTKQSANSSDSADFDTTIAASLSGGQQTKQEQPKKDDIEPENLLRVGQLAVIQTLGAKKQKRDEASILESTQPDLLLRQALEAAGQEQSKDQPKERPEPVPQGTLMKVQQKHADAAQPETRKVQALPQVQQSLTQPPKKPATHVSIHVDDGPSFEPSLNISVDNSLSLQLGTPQSLGTS